MGALAHVRFQQRFHGVPVEGAQYVVSLRRDGSVALANGTLHPDAFVPTTTPAVPAASARAAAFELGRAHVPSRDVSEELVVLPEVDGGPIATFRLVWKVRYRGEAPAFIDAATGQRLSAPIQVAPPEAGALHSVHVAERSIVASENSTAKNPNLRLCDQSDPTEPCGSVYLKHPGLTPSRSVVALSGLSNQSGVYNLQSGVYINASNAAGQQAAPSSGNFFYQDTDPRSETVMAYHHATEFRIFLGSIGYSPNSTAPVVVETALQGTGAEYVPLSGKILLRRSLDGVTPDAIAFEDKVVMHEFGHYVLDDLANLVSTSFTEEGAVTEGLPDYFAGAFTERSEILDWAAPQFRRNMAAPTGNNNSGGSQSPITTYSQYLGPTGTPPSVEPHRGGEFISFVLWTLRQSSAVPSGDLDRIVMAAVPMLSTDVDFLELRDDLIVASEELFGTQYEQAILDGFADKGIGVGVPPNGGGNGGGSNPSLYATITGPTCQDTTQPATFHRGAYGGGTDPHITTWRWRHRCGLSATPCDAWNQGTQGTDTYTLSRDEDYEIMLDVFDDNDDYGYSNIIAVNVDSGGCSQGATQTSSGKTGQSTGSSAFASASLNTEAAASPPRLISANPTRTAAEVAFDTSAPSEVTVSAVDVLGRYVVAPSTSALGEGAHRQHVDLSRAAPGVYVIRISVTKEASDPTVSAIPVTVVR